MAKTAGFTPNGTHLVSGMVAAPYEFTRGSASFVASDAPRRRNHDAERRATNYFANRTLALACERARSLTAADSGEFETIVIALSKSA